MMLIYLYGYWYVCGPILEPVGREAEKRGYDVAYLNTWSGHQVAGPSMEEVLTYPGPRALVLVCDNQTGAHMPGQHRVKEARAAGIPSISIQHGNYSVEMHPTADVTCNWGPYYDTLVHHDDIRHTGNPAWDGDAALVEKKAELREMVRQRVSRSCEMPYALFAASFRNQYSNRNLLLKAILDIAQVRTVIIRTHPNPDERSYDSVLSELARQHGRVWMWPGDDAACGLAELTMGADLVFGRSTVLVRAAVQGISALVVSDERDPRVNPYIFNQYGGAYEELTMYPPEVERRKSAFAELHNTAKTGAAARVVDVIEDVVKERFGDAAVSV
jgi:hypothetical protein